MQVLYHHCHATVGQSAPLESVVIRRAGLFEYFLDFLTYIKTVVGSFVYILYDGLGVVAVLTGVAHPAIRSLVGFVNVAF